LAATPARLKIWYLEMIMKFRSNQKTIAALAGSAFIATVGMAGATQAVADEAFAAHELERGYLLAAASESEGKCGEGKCGGDAKDDAEGKCGEGKCGGDANDDAEDKDGEGKCGGAA